MRLKQIKLLPSDIEGKFDINIDLKGTVKYQYYFKKVKDIVYKIQKIGNGEWEALETPLKEVPYIEWKD